ncbi:hypothetical protein EV361DRAFT_967454, partial [Lentinula raphanica]
MSAQRCPQRDRQLPERNTCISRPSCNPTSIVQSDIHRAIRHPSLKAPSKSQVMFEHLHPVDDIIRRAKEELQALTPFHLSEESLFDDVRDKLLANDALVDSMIAWTGANLGLSTSQATYPDRGIILNTLTDIMAHLVWDESGKIVDDLSDYKGRLEALDVEYFPVCPQRNIIISDNIHDGDDGEEEEEDSMDEDEHNKTRLQSLVTTWRNEERLVSSTDELYIDSLRLANRWNACLEQILVQISTGDYTQSIVNVIKQMKEVKKQVYSTAPYRLAMKTLNLPHITHGLLPTEANQMLTALRKELIGCGVSKVPFLDQVEPTQRTKEPLKARGSYNNAMYHPVAVGNKRPVMLQGLERDEEIIERCGHHLLLILDEKEDTQNPYSKLVEWATNVIDFIWWNPFSATTLALLQDAVVESTGVSSVNRGAQFESYAGGKMIPLGSRSASGGRAGDTYTSYAGLEATSDKGLGILFRQAATSDIMRSTAQHAHYMLAKDLAKVCDECDQMGMTGANIFNCTGYMAPLHTDKDAVRGLCSQVLLQADSKYDEYSFCNVEYQYYIKTTTNCLWSFDASNLHGTMLPSKQTISNLNSQLM